MNFKTTFFPIVFTFVILTITILTFPFITLNAFATPGTGTLFGMDSDDGDLITINPSTGVRTFIGNTFVAGPSLAVDSTTGKMFASTFGQSLRSLYEINPSTGEETFVGGLINANNAPGLDFSSDGTLFATANVLGMGNGGSSLATINENTGLLTIIGPLGVLHMGAIAFASDGTLYGATENKGVAPFGALYTINTTTGEVTLVTPIRDSSDDPHPGGFSSIQFACDGTLYYGGGSEIGDFGTININTGVYTQINSGTTVESLGGLAFQLGCGQDGDGIPNNIDNCPDDYNPSQLDIDGDDIGDACDDLNVISVDTIVSSDFTSLGNLIIQDNSLLTINSGITVTIQSGSNITIQSGSGVLIKSGGTLQINF